MRAAEFKDGYCFFYSSDCPLSNFYFHCEGFEATIDGFGSVHRFITGQQYYEYRKCQFFEDYASAKRILGLTRGVCANGSRHDYRATVAVEAKRIGYGCKGFDLDRWKEVQLDVMRDTLRKKFAHNVIDTRVNHPMSWHLYRTRYYRNVECSPHDKVWGIGMSRRDGRRFDKRCWLGRNLMGQCLDDVRQEFIASCKEDYVAYLASRDPIHVVTIDDDDQEDDEQPCKKKTRVSGEDAPMESMDAMTIVGGCVNDGRHALIMSYKFNCDSGFDELYYQCASCDFVVLACEVSDPNGL